MVPAPLIFIGSAVAIVVGIVWLVNGPIASYDEHWSSVRAATRAAEDGVVYAHGVCNGRGGVIIEDGGCGFLAPGAADGGSR